MKLPYCSSGRNAGKVVEKEVERDNLFLKLVG